MVAVLAVAAIPAWAQGVSRAGGALRETALRQAEDLARQGRWAEAADRLAPFSSDSALRRTFVQLSVDAGVAAWRRGNRVAARRWWERALRADPVSDDALADLGGLLAEEGRADSAVPLLRRARSVGARSERVGLALAGALAVAGRAESAAALYDTLLRRSDASVVLYESAARFWMATGRIEMAAGVVRRGVELYPRSASLLVLLGSVEGVQEHWQDAAAAYRRAVPLLEQPEQAELPWLDALLASHDTADALALGRILADRPASRALRLIVAAVADSLGDRALATSICSGLLAADSLDPDALPAAARLAENAADTVRAALLMARDTRSDSGGPEGPMGLLRLTRPESDSARQLVRRALWHGMTALEQLELELAASASTPPPGSGAGPDTRVGLLRRQRTRAALAAALDRAMAEPWGPAELDQLLLAWPGSLLLQQMATRLAERRGEFASALAGVEQLLRKYPADTDLLRARGRLLARLGRPAEAIEAFARALDVAPEDDSTFRALERLAEARGELRAVLAQVRRLRIRVPDSRALADHETEMQERLGEQPAAREQASPRGGERP